MIDFQCQKICTKNSALGQMEKAIVYLRQSLAVFEEIKSPNADLMRKWLEELD